MSHRIELRYAPAGATLRDFHLSGDFVRVLMGPLGSGKTTACAIELFRRAEAQPATRDRVRRSRWLVVRNTYPELLTTTVASWRAVFDDRFGSMNWRHPPTQTLKASLDDGTRMEADIIFMALDGPDAANKIRGLELTGAWINEAREVPKSVWDMLTGRVGRYPPAREGGSRWSGIIADTNMPDEDHWLYGLAEEESPAGWAFFKQPGAVQRREGKWIANPVAENLANLPARYYERQLAGKSEDWICVFLGAEYGFVREGKPVYPEYTDTVHCSTERFGPVKGIKAYVGIDFGLTPAAVFGQRMPNGRWIIFDELVCEDMGAVRFAEMLGPKLRGAYKELEFEIYGDPAGDARVQTDERTPFQILKAQGIQARAAPSNDFTLRREAVATALSRMIDGKAGLVLSPLCRTLRKGMAGGYAYRRVHIAGEDKYRDKPDKSRFSHVCEAAQYMMLGAGEGKRLVRRDAPGLRSSSGRPLAARSAAEYDPFRW